MQVSDALTGTINLPSAGLEVGDFELISRVNITSTQSAITFGGIPQGYKHLQLRMYGVFTGTVSAGYITFNNDNASGSYSAHNLFTSGGGGSNITNNKNSSQNKGFFTMDAGTSPTQPNSMVMDIHNYSNANMYKTTRHFYGWDSNGNGYMEYTSNNWRSTSGITSIQLTTSGNSWAAGSTIGLYGIRG